MCECECDKSCEVGEYLDCVNCKCRKRLIDKLVGKCDEDLDGNETIYKETLYDYGRVCRSYMLHVILLIIVSIIIMSINGACFYFYWCIKEDYFDSLPYYYNRFMVF